MYGRTSALLACRIQSSRSRVPRPDGRRRRASARADGHATTSVSQCNRSATPGRTDGQRRRQQQKRRRKIQLGKVNNTPLRKNVRRRRLRQAQRRQLRDGGDGRRRSLKHEEAVSEVLLGYLGVVFNSMRSV